MSEKMTLAKICELGLVFSGGEEEGGGEGFVGSDGVFAENWTGRDEFKDNAAMLNYNSVTDLANGLVATKKKLGKNPDTLVEIPSETSSDDVRAAWSKAHGRPDTQDLYEYTLSDEHAVKLGPLDDNNMVMLKEFAHKKNWNQQDFKEALDLYHTMQVTGVDTFSESLEESKTQRFDAGTAILKGQWLEGTDDRTAAALAHLRKYGEIEVKGADGKMINPLEKLFEEAPQLKQSPWLTIIMDNMAQKMGEADRKGGGGTGALSLDGINSQITGIRAQQAVIRVKNPVNFKGDPEFKRLEESLKVLYQKKPA
ncbi:hypothetical protein LCGC14_2776760 [marine sediment metagenome]|uniref:Uncharacterized protein n=1 Tax=marine sediment metagenome TaxID=412755 RepID=A0A0F9B391_9ZZZZ